MATSRRAFLERAALGGLAIGGLGLLDRLRPVSAAEATAAALSRRIEAPATSR